VLAAFGLSEDDDRVYGYLAGVLSADAAEVRAAVGLPGNRADTALKALTDHGFAFRLPDAEPLRFAAASPEVITERITGQLGELYRAQESLGKIAVRYRARQRALEGDLAEIIHGGEALRQRITDLMASARFEVLNMIKPPIVVVQSGDRMLPAETARGRLIYETEALDAPGAMDAIRQEMRAQDELRVHTKLPVKMLAIDRQVALIPVSAAGTTPVGVLVHESALLDALVALFDYVWSTSIRLHAGADAAQGPLAPADRHLLSLLLSGLTDEAIAVHLRVSERTIQRRVRSLMEIASVRTRMQLAWEAARQGWV
jgi:sugar-specific transcriptional regulator TrmB/DNA-binding CsgD family transcriptional regulator